MVYNEHAQETVAFISRSLEALVHLLSGIQKLLAEPTQSGPLVGSMAKIRPRLEPIQGQFQAFLGPELVMVENGDEREK